MRTLTLHRLTAVAALALTSLATAAACSSAPVRTPPVQAPITAPGTAATPTTMPDPTAPALPVRKPATTAAAADPTRSDTGPPCSGAVTRTIDASDTGRAWPRLCIAVGGVLRVENLGPEGFSMSPAGKVSCWYEGGVRECRLIHTGTVRFTITNAHQTRALTVVIAKASSPPRPSPACLDAGTVHAVDAADSGPPWGALCMKIGAVLRVENLGPDGFSVSPRGAVACRYEAAIRQCRFKTPATVTFTIKHTEEIRTLTVVAVR